MIIAGLARVAATTLFVPISQSYAILLAVVLIMALFGTTICAISAGLIAHMATRYRAAGPQTVFLVSAGAVNRL